MDTARLALVCSSLALSGLLLVGCGTETAPDLSDVLGAPRSHPTPDGLTCPSGEMVGTAGGYLEKWPDGPETPEQLVAEQSTVEEPWVLDGRRAYVLRADGTAFEVHDLVKGPKGWFLQGYEACAD